MALILLLFCVLICYATELVEFKIKSQGKSRLEYQLIEGNDFYKKIAENEEFRANNSVLWIENSMHGLLKNMHIVVFHPTVPHVNYFGIEYQYQSDLQDVEEEDIQNLCTKFHMWVYPTRYAKFKFKIKSEKNMPALKTSAYSKMFIKTVALTYGYFWLKSVFNMLRNAYDTSKTDYDEKMSMKVLKQWVHWCGSLIYNLNNPIYIKDFFFLQMKRNFNVNHYWNFKVPMLLLKKIQEETGNEYEALPKTDENFEQDFSDIKTIPSPAKYETINFPKIEKMSYENFENIFEKCREQSKNLYQLKAHVEVTHELYDNILSTLENKNNFEKPHIENIKTTPTNKEFNDDEIDISQYDKLLSNFQNRKTSFQAQNFQSLDT
jgi:hypothetical protein